MKLRLIALLCALSLVFSLGVTALGAENGEVSVQRIVYDFLTEELELCPAAAAGIMGNVMIECGFDPDIEHMDTNDKLSYGLMMWNGSRYEALKEWCTEHGYEKSDPMGQLTYLKWELENTEKASYRYMKEIPNTVEGAVRAAILWADKFERCTKTSYGLRVYYALNNYWEDYAGGTVSGTPGIYGYYYNVPDNLKYGEPLTLYGAVVSYSSPLRSLTAGVYTEDGQLVTGKTVNPDCLAGNIGVIDRFVVMNRLPKGSYYYTITAVNDSDEYIVERHGFTVSDEPTATALVTESEGGVICELGAECPQLQFRDMLPAAHWAHDSVDHVLTKGYFLGNGGGLFMPQTDMSRAMFVTVLHRMADEHGLTFDSSNGNGTEAGDASDIGEGVPETDADRGEEPTEHSTASADSTAEVNGTVHTTDTTGSADSTATNPSADTSGEQDEPQEPVFTDVDTESWYGEHVMWAYEKGLVMGKGEGVFDPDGQISRGELAVLMYRLAERCGFDVGERASLDVFTDGDSLPEWASEELSWAVSAGLVNGVQTGGGISLDCAGVATREQVAAIALRFGEYIADAPRADADGQSGGMGTESESDSESAERAPEPQNTENE